MCTSFTAGKKRRRKAEDKFVIKQEKWRSVQTTLNLVHIASERIDCAIVHQSVVICWIALFVNEREIATSQTHLIRNGEWSI